MADSDKDILITPNTGVASTHPKMTFTGKDNSPIDLKILDDNTLSFEGVQGQVFSISPILNSGDIFSVNDISGVQSMAINADGTIKMLGGNVGIGTTSPASLLHIEGDTTSLVTGLIVNNVGSAGNSASVSGIEIRNGTGTDSSTHIEQDAFGKTRNNYISPYNGIETTI